MERIWLSSGVILEYQVPILKSKLESRPPGLDTVVARRMFVGTRGHRISLIGSLLHPNNAERT